MKRNAEILFSLCGLVLIPTLAAFGQTGLYVKADVGGNVTEDVELREFFGPVAPGTKLELDPGFRAGFSVGYQLTDFFAPEAEIGYLGNRVNFVSGADLVHDTWFYNVPFFVNAKFQIPRMGRCPVTPYAGAGVGFSETVFDIGHIDLNGIHVNGSDSAAVFAWQAFAGLRFAINNNMGICVEYHYFYADPASWHAEFASFTPSDRISLGPTHSHAASVAFEFRF